MTQLSARSKRHLARSSPARRGALPRVERSHAERPWSQQRSTRGVLALSALVIIPIAVLVMAPGWLLLTAIFVLAAWLGWSEIGRQSWAVAWVGISTIPKRLGSASVVVVGIASVVGVLVALFAMATGFESTVRQTGTNNTAIVLQAGSQSEVGSMMDHETVDTISQAPQILTNVDGQPILSSEWVVTALLPKRRTGLDASVQIRGVGEQAWDLRPNVKIIAGRRFTPGLHELVIGKGIQDQFATVDLDSELKLNGVSWTVVGVFDSGDAHNSEIWADGAAVASAFRRDSGVSSLTVRLADHSALKALKAGIASDPRLKVSVYTTRQYYSQQVEGLSRIIRALGAAVGAIMAVGAIFGALNAMCTAIAAREREIATLRAIGFYALPVIVAILLETMLLSLFGALLGAGIAWAIFDGYTTSTAAANVSQLVFAFRVSPELLWIGLKWALAIGLIGGLFPAVRAARAPVTEGLREL